MSTLAECLDYRVEEAGGVRALSKSSGVDPGYITRLRMGSRTDPSDETLACLGIKKTVEFSLQGETV